MDKMKNVVHYVIIALLAIYALYVYRGRQEIERQRQIQAVELSVLKDSVTMYKTRSGQLYGQVQAVEIDKRNLKEALEVAGFDLRALKDQNVKYRQIIATLRMEIESINSGTTTVVDTFRIVERDTIYYQSVKDWDDGALFLSNMKIENKQLDFNYRYNVGLSHVTTRNRKGTIVTIVPDSPHTKIVTGQSIVINDDKKKLWERPIIWGAAGFVGGLLVK